MKVGVSFYDTELIAGSRPYPVVFIRREDFDEIKRDAFFIEAKPLAAMGVGRNVQTV